MAKRILKGFGKFLVFLLLNGLGGILAAIVLTAMFVGAWAWILGRPEHGTPYGNVVEVVSYGLWGLVGAVVAVRGYSEIFRQYPPRWMGITFVSANGFGWIVLTAQIIFALPMGEEIELDQWKDFAHVTASMATFWFLFSLPPLSRNEYDRQVAIYRDRKR